MSWRRDLDVVSHVSSGQHLEPWKALVEWTDARRYAGEWSKLAIARDLAHWRGNEGMRNVIDQVLVTGPPAFAVRAFATGTPYSALLMTAARAHAYGDLASRLPTQVAGAFAFACVIAGQDLSTEPTPVDGLVPMRLQPWEPWVPQRKDDDELSVPREIPVGSRRPVRLEPDKVSDAFERLVAGWRTQRGNEAHVACFAGDVDAAIAGLDELGPVQASDIAFPQAAARLASIPELYAGPLAARLLVWSVLAALAGVQDERPYPAHLIVDYASTLRWVRVQLADSQDSIETRNASLAVSDSERRRAWALVARTRD